MSSTDAMAFYHWRRNLFLVHQITFQCPARPKVYVTDDWGSLVAKNVCYYLGEKLMAWLFKVFCQYGREKKTSEVEIKELLMGVGSISAPWKRGIDSLPTFIQEWGDSVLLLTMQDASFLHKCMESRPLKIVAIIRGVRIHLNIWMTPLLENLNFVEMEGYKNAKYLGPLV